MTAPVRRGDHAGGNVGSTVGGRARALLAAMPKGLPHSPLKGVDWKLSFVAFVAYMGAITTQRAPIGSVAMVAALVFLFIEGKQLSFPTSMYWLLSLIIWSFAGLFFTNFPDLVSDAVKEFAKIALVSFVLVNVVTSRSRLRFYLLAITFFYFIYPLRGTLQYYFIVGETLNGRAIWNHMYSNPNDLAGFCILQLSIVLGMLEVEKQKAVRAFALLCAVLLPLIIVLTQSRGALMALTVFMGFALRKHWRNLKTMSIVVVLGIAIVLIAPKSVWERVGTISDEKNEVTGEEEMTDAGSSTAGRIQIWKIAVRMIAERPLGVGLGAYSEEHDRLVRRLGPGDLRWMAWGKRDTHSTYLKIMAERGIPGLFFFSGLIIAIGIAAARARKRSANQFPALSKQMFYMELGLYGYLVAGIWGSYDEWVPTYTYLMLVFAMTRLLEQDMNQGGVPAQVRTASGANGRCGRRLTHVWHHGVCRVGEDAPRGGGGPVGDVRGDPSPRTGRGRPLRE